MGGECGMYWRQERCIEVLVWKPEGKIPLRRRRHRWDNNIKMDLQKWIVEEWTGLI
jgi:hypothetical protein